MKWRLFSIFLVFALLLSALVLRLGMIQIINGGKYKQQMKLQSYSYLSGIPVRGTIYDRNRTPITNDEEGLILLIEKNRINQDIKNTIEALDATLIDNDNDGKYHLYVAKVTNNKELDSLQEKYGSVIMKYPFRYSRYRPGVDLIGSTDADGNKGLCGIEKDFEKVLNSDTTEYSVRSDGLGHLLTGEGIHIEGDGRIWGVLTTLDLEIQRKLEGILSSNEEIGTAIITDVKKGEILASAAFPGYADGDIKKYNKADEKIENKATEKLYKAGPIFDIVLAAAGMEKAITTGSEYLTKDVYNNIKEKTGYPAGEADIIDMIKNLGLSEKPVSNFSEQSKGSFDDFYNSIKSGEHGVLSGYENLLITPMQAARMTRIIAAEGKDVELRLVKGTMEGIRGTLYFPVNSEKQSLSMETARVLERYAEQYRSAERGDDPEDDRVRKIVVGEDWCMGFIIKKEAIYGVTVYLESIPGRKTTPEMVFNEIIDELYYVSIS